MFRKIRKQRWLKRQNMLELVPYRKVPFEVSSDQRIVLQLRRFPIKGLARFMGKSEFVRISLDEKGSLVWKKIDSNRTIAQICAEIASHGTFDKMEMLEERVATFILSLYRQGFVDFMYEAS